MQFRGRVYGPSVCTGEKQGWPLSQLQRSPGQEKKISENAETERWTNLIKEQKTHPVRDLWQNESPTVHGATSRQKPPCPGAAPAAGTRALFSKICPNRSTPKHLRDQNLVIEQNKNTAVPKQA